MNLDIFLQTNNNPPFAWPIDRAHKVRGLCFSDPPVIDTLSDLDARFAVQTSPSNGQTSQTLHYGA
jgi:hypothetical protein